MAFHAGDLGGFIEHERNLSQAGSCWVSGKAVVLDEASVSEDAYVSGWPRCLIADHAKVYGKAKVCVASQVRDYAEVSGDAWLYGMTTVKDYAKIKDPAHICSTTIGGEVVVCDEAYTENYRPAISGNDIIGGKTRLLFSVLEKLNLNSTEMVADEPFYVGKFRGAKCKNHKIYVREEDLIKQIKDELCRYTIDKDFYRIAIEALAEEDEIEVAKQNEKIASINKRIADKTNELNNLRRSLYKGLIDDNAFFLAEQEDIKKKIDKLEADRNKVKTAANNWRDKANDIFMFARYTKEDFDSDDWERKRAVIKRLGADLKLSDRTRQFTPVKYLVPIAEKYPELREQFELARTDSGQIKKTLKKA